MNRTVASILVFIYASFAPLCFASAITPATTQTPIAVPHAEHSHTHTLQATTQSSTVHCHGCTVSPFEIVSAHAQMYSTITVPVSALYVLVVLLLVVLATVGIFRVYRAPHTFNELQDIAHHRHRARVVTLVHTRRLLAWISFLTRSPGLILVHA